MMIQTETPSDKRLTTQNQPFNLNSSQDTLFGPAQRAAWQRDGYLILKGCLGDRELQPVRDLISANVDKLARKLDREGKIHDLHERALFHLRLAEIARGLNLKLWGWNHEVFEKGIYDLLMTPALLEVAEALVGPEVQVNGDYWVRPKLPNESASTLPWHQDAGYYGNKSEDSRILSMWIPLVDVDEENGCMQFIPGSQKWGLLPTKINEINQHVPAEDIEARGQVETLQMSVGDVVIFGNLTFHRSLMNRSDHVRWSIDLRYAPIGTNVEWLDRSGMQGFITRSKANPNSVESWDQWKAKRSDARKKEVVQV